MILYDRSLKRNKMYAVSRMLLHISIEFENWTGQVTEVIYIEYLSLECKYVLLTCRAVVRFRLFNIIVDCTSNILVMNVPDIICVV